MQARLSQAALRILMILAVLLVASMAGAEEPGAIASDTADLETVQATEAGTTSETLDADDAAPLRIDLGVTPETWQLDAAGACQYTCPNGFVQLCPRISGYTVTCVNECCVYC
jgi:hypothetical protein